MKVLQAKARWLFSGSVLAFALGGLACGGGSEPPPTFSFPWDWVGIIGTGQSLGVGGYGTPVKGTAQPYNNLKLAFGGATVEPPFDPAIASLELVPLVEPIRPLAPTYPSAYPANIYGETPATAMANQLTALAMEKAKHDYLSVHSVVGESGQGLSVIRKDPTNLPTTGTGGRAYAATLFEATAIARLAAAAGKTYGIGAIVMTHGETDAGNLNYATELYQFLSDNNQDLLPITGQTTPIPMLLTQQNSVPTTTGSVAVSALQAWKASVDHPGEIVCTGPKYQYSYAADSTHVHLNATDYERIGEKTAQVYFERVVMGRDWRPLEPTTIEMKGKVIKVHFHVPVPPLTWDEALPQPHGTMIPEWAQARGFEVTTSGISRQAIDSVKIVGRDTVEITTRNDLTGLSVAVGYAATAEGGTPPQAQAAYWGQLKDSDPFVGSTTGTKQPNYGVAFILPVPAP